MLPCSHGNSKLERGVAMNPKVRVVVQLMKSNLHRKLTLDEVAEVAGLGHSRLNDLFKSEFDNAPLQHHKILRLQKACDLLENTFWRVDRIRLEVGYDHSHFFKDFKAHFGLTPSQYRAGHGNANLS